MTGFNRQHQLLRLLTGAVSLSVVALLFAGREDASLSSMARRLSVANRGDGYDEFLPQMTYTKPGTFPNTKNVQVNFHLDGYDSDSAKWYGTQTVQAEQSFSFTITNFPTATSKTRSTCPKGIIVWFESVDTKAVFSAPAFYAEGSSQLDSNPELVVKTSIVDSGSYRVHIVAYESRKLEEGAHGNVGDVRPIPGSPWTLDVLPAATTQNATEAIRRSLSSSLSSTQIKTPIRICDSSDLEVSGKGRWVECSAAGITPDQCLYDGWVYLPYNCRWDLFTTQDALDTSRVIAQNRGRPVWIVFTGSSIERGTLHAMVDMIGSIGHYDPHTDSVDESIADALFHGIENVRGQGSMTKCWGWYDVQIGNIRLSYQDFRMTYIGFDAPDFKRESMNRFREIVQEGPDHIVLGDIHIVNHEATPYDEILKAVADTPSFDGVVTVAVQKTNLPGGGIGETHLCEPKDIQRLSATATELVPSIVESTRDKINTVLGDMGESGARLANRIAVADEGTMAWSFLFDAERMMSEPTFSIHYHIYSQEGVPRPTCGSTHSNRRYVVGAVSEMAAQMYLSTTLTRLFDQLQAQKADIEDPRKRTCDPYPTHEFEMDIASTNSFKACFSCPVNNCCDYPVTKWLPARTPGQSLSDPILKNVEGNFHDGNREFCYDGTI